MSTALRYLAVDLGAESGRVVAGAFTGEAVVLDELHRFPNVPLRTPDGLHWDLPRLYTEILAALRMARVRYGDAIAGIGVCSWGVDYGLLDGAGRLLGLPYSYRDARTDGLDDQVAAIVPRDEHFRGTGIAQLPFNTIYQLYAQRRHADPSLDIAGTLLMIPDLLHYWLSGERVAEITNASTSGALNVDGTWATSILERLDIPSRILLPPVPAGTRIGALRAIVQAECGLGAVPVIAPPTHDTASAVVAVPASVQEAGQGHAYISSGTWSLLGLELDHPIATEAARLAGFTNERGIGGTYRFLTNIMGLWLIQECRRGWARSGHEWSYEELTARAAKVPSPGVRIEVDDPAFLHPDDMLDAIRAQLTASGQGPIDDPVALVRAILEGLAERYRTTLELAERLAGIRVQTIHIVGGGARNDLLCRLTAQACNRSVLAGPVEGTALGNILAQAMGQGEVGSLAQARQIVRASAQLTHYAP